MTLASWAMGLAAPAARATDREFTLGDSDLKSIWRKLIDHPFYAGAGDGLIRLEPIRFERAFREPIDGRHLSDHPGIDVHYRLSWD